MATGQSLLDLMEVLDNELQNQPAEADVNRSLAALNAAQDQFEARLAQFPDVKGGQVGTVTTTASTEATAFPTGVLRIDGLQMLQSGLPIYDLWNIKRRGGQVWSRQWPNYLILTTAPGQPNSYWTNGRNIYWAPLPNDTYTVRWMGFQAAADITVAGTFTYDDIVQLPLASFATRLMKMGVGDGSGDVGGLAAAQFDDTIKTLGNFNRDGAEPLQYSGCHDT